MDSSARLALSAFLRNMGSISLPRNLKAFIFRSLLLWPRFFRSLRKIWSWYFGTNSGSRDGKKTGGNVEGPSSSAVLWERKEYSVVCASRAFEEVGDPSQRHSISRSSDAGESIQLSPVIERSPSNPYHLSSPSRPETPHSFVELTIHRSNTPLSWTHPRAASNQFTGTSSRSRSRLRSPSPSLFHRNVSRSHTPERPNTDVSTRPAMIQDSQGSPEVSVQSPEEITVEVRPATPPEISYSPPQSPVSSIRGRTTSLPTPHPFPSTESVNSSVDSSHSGRPSFSGSIQARSQQLINASPEPPLALPEPNVSRISLQVPLTNAPGTEPVPGNRWIRPMHPEQVSRYVKKGDVSRKKSDFDLHRMTVELPHSYRYDNDLGGWESVIHPGGALYFYHEPLRIFTDVYMYDPVLRAEVHAFANQLREQLSELLYEGTPLPTDHFDLVLDIIETKDKKTIWQYYYVDHKTEMVFWPVNYNMRGLLSEIHGVQESGHIKHRLQSLYWVHWSLYPVGYEGRRFPDNASEKLLGILLSGSMDSLTSRLSTAPYSVADMQIMRDIIKEAKDLGTKNADAISSIARLLSICVQWRFVHFHGQKTSRQNRYKSIYEGDGHKRTILIRLLSPILFYTPDVHLRELRKVWADELVIEEVWKDFMQKLVSEWVEFILYSTVMLTANVGFLAIQVVIIVPQDGWIKASPTQIASSISLVYSLGSIIIGQLLIRRNRTMAMQDTKTAWNYLDCMKKSSYYLEPLAIIYSLPNALLMWSTWVFFIAVLLLSFQNTTTEIRVLIGAAAAFVAALIIWCIVNSWDSGKEDSREDELIDIPTENEPNITRETGLRRFI
ncbi:hypothetical protein BJV74DRAFT_335849 [Russula compacta]|nr:hypothetical protein BJV74DRAFT_335849 [Russula compacta]